MLIASLIKHAAAQTAQALKGPNKAPAAGGSAFANFKGAIRSGSSSRVHTAMGDVRKMLASAGSISAANSLASQMTSGGAALKSSGSHTGIWSS
ncbi:MAG TPA: hypothetical protein VGL53_10465 [Bryobacteraceae bacterium]|jgi:hypothetical protein